MIQESELLKKLPFKQNLNHIRTTLGMIRRMDKGYWPGQAVYGLLHTGVEYGALILSDYVVN